MIANSTYIYKVNSITATNRVEERPADTKEHDQDKSDNEPVLKDHSRFFLFDFDESEYVSNLYPDQNEIFKQVEDMLFTKNTKHLEKHYYELKNSSRLSFGTHNINSLGFVMFNEFDISDAEIFIVTEQSIVGLVATLVHELQHYYDLKCLAKKRLGTTTYNLEVSAFSKEYDLLKDVNFLASDDYKKLSALTRDMFELSNFIANSKHFSLEDHKKMKGFLVTVGYNRYKLSVNRFVIDKSMSYNIAKVSSPVDEMIIKNRLKYGK
jgi:hypothetical protein